MRIITKNAVLRLTFGALFTTILTTNSFGQTNYQHLETVVSQSVLIVEGEVTATECFWDENHTRIYTSNLVEVKTKMKGELRSQFIEVLTVGGQVGDDFLMVSHNVTIGKGWKGLLFLNTLEVEGERTTAFRSSANPSYRIWDRATYYYDRINPPAVFHHSTVKDIEAELLQPVERFTGQPKHVYDPNFQRPSTALEAMARDFVESIELAPSDPETAASAPTTIEYIIDNPELTGTWPKYLEFDLKAKCNVSGTEFAKGEIWVNYNIDAFGPNIVGSGYLTWTEESFLAMGDYTVTANDEAIDKVKLKVDHIGSLEFADLNELPEIQEALLHLKLRVDDISQIADITFDQDTMDEKSKYRSAARADTLYPYDIVIAVDEQTMLPAPTGSSSISFNMANMNVVEDTTGDYWFETDIEARSSGDSIFWVSSIIHLRVDSPFLAVTFADLSDTSNFQLLKAGLSDNPNIDIFPSSNLSHNLVDFRIRDTVNWVSGPENYPSDGMYLTPNYQLIAKVRMRISQCNNIADVYFYHTGMTNGSKYYSDTSGIWNYYGFNPTIVGDGFSTLVCPDSIPVIYSFDPQSISAGTFDTLTINGANFGSFVSGVSKTFFHSAEFHRDSLVYTIPNDHHIQQWNDSVIQVWVPSRSADSLGYASASTGIVGVQVSNGVDTLQVFSNDTLDVRYSILNGSYGYSGNPRMFVLGNQNQNGGYTFQLSDSLDNRITDVFDQVSFSIDTWVCETNVNFVLDTTATVDNVFSTSDNICKINLVPYNQMLGSPNNLMETIYHFHVEDCENVNGDSIFMVLEIDIQVNEDVPWFNGNTLVDPLPVGMHDFITTLIHELGHAHMLNHALYEGKVMYPFNSGLTVLHSLHSADDEGGERVMSFDTISPGFCSIPEMIPHPDCVGNPQSVDEMNSASGGISIFPNPTSAEFRIIGGLNADKWSIRLLDVLGQEVGAEFRQIGNGEYLISPEQKLSGLFLVVLTQDDRLFSGRIIIQ